MKFPARYLKLSVWLLLIGLVSPLAHAKSEPAPSQPSSVWTQAWFGPAFSKDDAALWKTEPDYAGRTVRTAVRLEIAGSAIRLRFGNVTNTADVDIKGASIFVRKVAGSSPALPVTFNGQTGVTVRAGAVVYSDPLPIDVARFDELVLSVNFPAKGPIFLAGHLEPIDLAPGDWTQATNAPSNATHLTGPTPLEGVEVLTTEAHPLLIAIGDSITDGAKSTPGAHKSWPEQFAVISASNKYSEAWVVVNSGLSGNRVLRSYAGQSLLARFDRDVTGLCGASAVVLLEGVNDIFRGTTKGGNPDEKITADDLITAYKQIIVRAHAKGLRVYGATIIPFEGPDKAYPTGELVRLQVNSFIRNSGEFDDVVDFDKVMKDPNDSERLAAVYDSGDHVHPNDQGYGKMAAAFALIPLPSVSPKNTCD